MPAAPLALQRRLFASGARVVYARFNSNGKFPLWAVTHDIEFIQTPMFLDTQGTFHGRDGVRDAMRELYEGFGEMRFEPRRLIMPSHDRFVVVVDARTVSSGVPMERQVGHRYELTKGRVSRMETHWEVADAIAALSLSQAEADRIAIPIS